MNTPRERLGVVCQKWMPLEWTDRSAASQPPERQAWRNQVNEKRLQTLLERETRERPPQDIANIEALLIEVLHCVKQPPLARSVTLAAETVEWAEKRRGTPIKVGDTGILRMGLDAELPYEVEFFAEIVEVEDDEAGHRLVAKFAGQSERVMELYEQLVFIYYRRSQRGERKSQLSE